jgi:hypothetical protein
MRRTRSARLLTVLTLIAVFAIQLIWVAGVAQAAPIGSATVSGKVTDKVTGSAIASAFVQIYYKKDSPPDTWTEFPGVYTAADGSYTTTLTPSYPFPRECALIITDPSRDGSPTAAHRPTWWPDVDMQHASITSKLEQAATMAGHFTLNEGDALAGITGKNVQMKLNFPAISGKVVDRAGKPLQGIWVQPYVLHFASWSDPVGGSESKTDAAGNFTVRVNPWLQAGCYQTLVAKAGLIGTTRYDGRWFSNTLNKPSLGLVEQAEGASVTRLLLKSGETTSGLVIRMTRNTPDVVSITKTWRTTGRVGHVKGKLTPVHDPAIPVRVQFYKYSASKHKYLAYGKPLTATASSSGNVTYWSAKRTLKKGKFAVRAYVAKHLWTYHRAHKTGLSKFTVR